MKKSIIITWIALLLIKQGIIAGDEQKLLTWWDNTTKIHGTTIIVKQESHCNITQEKNVDAIVNAANFNLAHGGGVAGALREADPEWDKYCAKEIENFKKDGFKDGGTRAVVTPAFELKKRNGIQYIVNAVGPEGDDPQWEAKLNKTYLDVLDSANKYGIKNIVIPPISTGIFAKNAKGKVVITPGKAAKIAISATKEFLQNNPDQFQTIQFTSIESDGLVHFLAYKNALKFKLSEQEQKIAQKAEKEYIAKLEKK